MRKKNRLAAVFMTSVLVLTGCGSAEAPAGTEGQSAVQPEEKEAAQNDMPYVQPEMKGEITVSCLTAEEFLEAAAEKFMEIYPDIKVTINSYSESSGENTVKDYQAYLNTKVMTGKAEDILFTHFLPITKYSEMGVFEDLSGYVTKTPELNDENIFMNVLQSAQEEDGKLYIIPYVARFDTLDFSPELMEEQSVPTADLKEMKGLRFSYTADIAKQMVDKTDKRNAFLMQMNEVAYANYRIKDELGRFIDPVNKKANLDAPEYIELLESVKALSENGYFGSDIDYYNTEYYFAATCDYDVQAAFFSMDSMSGTQYCSPMADAEGRIPIKSNSCVALNSSSENKDLAWEFIRYLLSEKVQTLPSIHGPAVNRKGLEAVAKRYYNFYKEGGGTNVQGGEDQYLSILENWMEQINSCDTVDFAIMTMIDEENAKYFAGRQTAQDTARLLQRQIEQYFNE